MKKKILALIPARSGSQRLKNKNIKKINGHPLIAYSIIEAKKSKLFDDIIVSTNSKKYSIIAKKYGAKVPFLRPNKFSRATSSDFQWVRYTINKLKRIGLEYDFFFILRPTNPFRTARTIKRAWSKFIINLKKADTLRAVEPCKQHPYKMWLKNKLYINPLIKKKHNGQPYYNMQTKSLPKIFIQNASLEISKVRNLEKYKTITGKKIVLFLTKKFEGLDINYEFDLFYAKYLIKKKVVKLEAISKT